MGQSDREDRYYRIGTVTIRSAFEPASFQPFACDPADADVRIERTEERPPEGKGIRAGFAEIRRVGDEWLFQSAGGRTCLYVSRDYTRLRQWVSDESRAGVMDERLVRIALECLLIRRGYLSMHSACIALDGEAIAFCGPSGIGKSTWAGAWTEACGAELISGDRPLIHAGRREVSGVPWDGKEKCYRNVCSPLRCICEVRRSAETYVRALSFEQRRRLLLRQCFIPMWDTDTAAVQMMNISRLASGAAIFRAFGGPTAEDARALRRVLDQQNILKEEKDMKVKEGFVLRDVAGEYILMPVGDNIGRFNGTLLMNEITAFIWGKLQNPVSREDLLKAVLNEYETDEATAAADLDMLLEKLRGFGVIEED